MRRTPGWRRCFADDAKRLDMLSLDVAGIHFDWSKTHLTRHLVSAFETLAKNMDLAGRREAMFASKHVNVTEDRPVEHTPPSAVRATRTRSRAPAPITPACAR